MALIDLDKFVASFITEMKECSQMRNFSIPRCIKKALQDQGLDYKGGEIVKSQRKVSAESKENGYGESEDERIRKAIHIYLDWLDGRNKDYQPKGDYSIKDMIAWLEKQDGRKLAEWNEEDENCLSTIIAEFSKCAGKSVSKDEWMRCNDFLNSLRDRVYAKQKWTEEDEGFLNLLFAIFTNEHPNGVFTTDNIPVFNGNCVTSNRIISWLKSIKQRIGG